MHAVHTADRLHVSSADTDIVGIIKVPPSTYRKTPVRFLCGLYEQDMPEPGFWLTVTPDPRLSGTFVSQLERLDDEDTGDYQLIYLFDNFDGPEYTVTIHSSDAQEVRDDGRR